MDGASGGARPVPPSRGSAPSRLGPSQSVPSMTLRLPGSGEGDSGEPIVDGRPEADIPRPAQLPADIGGLHRARDACRVPVRAARRGRGTGSTGAVRIAVVNGAGGLGKTTLAIHAAHRVRKEFPDGQLYVDLLGASEQPAEPGEVLARFLRDLGVDGDKLPARDDERAALYPHPA